MQERPIHNPVCANPAEHESTIAQVRWKHKRDRCRPPAPRIRCRGSIKSGALVLVLVSTLIALAGGLWLPLPLLGALLNENGPIENASVIFYGLAIAAVWMARNPSFGRAAAMASTIILISCIARETSLRRWLIDAGATSPCCSRATVGTLTALLVLLLIVSAAWLTVHYRKRLWDAIRRRSSVATTLLVLFCTLLASQAMDKLPGVLQRAGMPLAARGDWAARAIEEILEMTLPLLIIVAAWQARRSRERPDNARRSD